MAIHEIVVPADSDLEPCPGLGGPEYPPCGGFTNDPAGGPCSACWRRLDEPDDRSADR